MATVSLEKLVKRYGCGLTVTEMIASQAMIRNTRQTMKMVEKSPEEFPMSVQIAGCEPEVMAEAARLLGVHRTRIYRKIALGTS